MLLLTFQTYKGGVQNSGFWQEVSICSLFALMTGAPVGPNKDMTEVAVSKRRVSDLGHLDPTTWTLDQALLDRPGNSDIQLDMLYDYGSNVPLYPQFQEFLRKYQPPTLIVWRKNDYILPPEGAAPYNRDLSNVETHLLDTGHFALETHGEEIASRIEKFFARLD
jgi:pimeloyl-ACP methyl ester carboxylesterase